MSSNIKGITRIFVTAVTLSIAVTITLSPIAGLLPDVRALQYYGPYAPTVVITQPSADVTVASNISLLMEPISGYASVSPYEITGINISSIVFSLDGAFNVSVPEITKVVGTTFYFNFSIPLTPNTALSSYYAIHTIVVYATDDAGHSGASPIRTIRVFYPTEIPWNDLSSQIKLAYGREANGSSYVSVSGLLSGGTTFSWGTPTIEGNNISFNCEIWPPPPGIAEILPVPVSITHTYILGDLTAGEYTFEFTGWNVAVGSITFYVEQSPPVWLVPALII